MTYSFEDLDVFFADFSVSLAWDGSDYPCLFSNTYDSLSFQAGGRLIRAIAKFSDLGTIAQGETVVIDSKSYSVAEVRPKQDGAIVELELEEI
jgi:hypothetical protein